MTILIITTWFKGIVQFSGDSLLDLPAVVLGVCSVECVIVLEKELEGFGIRRMNDERRDLCRFNQV